MNTSNAAAHSLDIVGYANDAKIAVRAAITAYLREHGDRVFLSVGFEDIPGLKDLHVDDPAGCKALEDLEVQLEGYVGAAMREHPNATQQVPCRHKLYFLAISRRIEVVLLTRELEACPAKRLAVEIATLAAEQSALFKPGQAFNLVVPEGMHRYLCELPATQRHALRDHLNKRLAEGGVVIMRGYFNQGLVVQRVEEP